MPSSFIIPLASSFDVRLFLGCLVSRFRIEFEEPSFWGIFALISFDAIGWEKSLRSTSGTSSRFLFYGRTPLPFNFGSVGELCWLLRFLMDSIKISRFMFDMSSRISESGSIITLWVLFFKFPPFYWIEEWDRSLLFCLPPRIVLPESDIPADTFPPFLAFPWCLPYGIRTTFYFLIFNLTLCMKLLLEFEDLASTLALIGYSRLNPKPPYPSYGVCKSDGYRFID